MNAAALCTLDVVTCYPDMSIVDAAALMRSRHAGDLVVVREDSGKRFPEGLLTDRDIVLAVVSPAADPAALFVRDVMSSPAVVAQGGDDIWLLARRMRQHGVRRLPVVDDEGGPIGIVALDDLLHAVAELLDEMHYVTARQPKLEEKRRAPRRFDAMRGPHPRVDGPRDDSKASGIDDYVATHRTNAGCGTATISSVVGPYCESRTLKVLR